MRLVIFRGLFGTWGWEQLDDDGKVIAESGVELASREECLRDAQTKGFAAAQSDPPSDLPG